MVDLFCEAVHLLVFDEEHALEELHLLRDEVSAHVIHIGIDTEGRPWTGCHYRHLPFLERYGRAGRGLIGLLKILVRSHFLVGVAWRRLSFNL